MLELLEPYFSRINYTNEQKKAWFREREGVLFGMYDSAPAGFRSSFVL